ITTPEEFVRRFGGTRAIEKVLISNNGIAAVKCMTSVRRWSYEMFGNERAIKFCSMVTPDDLKANAEYIKMADHYVMVPGGTNNHNYANVDLIVEIAKRTKSQAVWAGWGHASENPRLPELLHKNDIAFIGPPEHAMWALGDKIASSIVAQTAGVPTMPWSGSGTLKIDWVEEDVAKGKVAEVTDEVYKKGCVTTVDEGVNSANKIGYPVMIKASEGGGGKGIRKVESEKDFPTLFRQVQSEVPGSPIFIMKLAKCARHLEVQILADQYGQAISLYGRDCSVQRRHQKIIEEAPAAIALPEVFRQMEKAAVTLARMVRYVSAGTVEYLYTEEDGFYFLELNPRLQVEHPCTEMVTDINLPAAQLQIAMGIPLHRISSIRNFYGENPLEDTPIDFSNIDKRLPPKGHVIAARITAENPDENFKPSGGMIHELNFRSSNNVWGYFSVIASGSIHEFADSQFGHCFAWGENREDARRNMVVALQKLSIRADFRTTVEYLIKLMETDDFCNNEISTSWLDALISKKVKAEKPDIMLAVITGALHVASNDIQKRYSTYGASLERGQVLPVNLLTNTVNVELIHDHIKYELQVTRLGLSLYAVVMNSSYIEVEVHRLSDSGLLISLRGNSYTTYITEEVDKYRVVIGGKTCIFEKESDPTILRSPSAGKLVQFLVEDGGAINPTIPYAEIEARLTHYIQSLLVMKMIMSLISTESGKIHYVKRPGAILEPASVLATLELDDPNLVKKAQLFTGKFTNEQYSRLEGAQVHQIFKASLELLLNLMDGYCIPKSHFIKKLEKNIETLVSCLRDPALPLLELKEIMHTMSGRIPASIENAINKELAIYSSNITSVLCQFPSQQIANIIDAHASTLTKRVDRDSFFLNTQTILQLVRRYRNGTRGHMKSVVISMLKKYIEVETIFNQGNYDKCVAALREKYSDNLSLVVTSILSHSQVAMKNTAAVMLIDHISSNETGLTDELIAVLSELTKLNNQENAKVALRARQVLIAAHQPSYQLRRNQVESIFLSAIDMHGHQFCPDNLQKLIVSETSIFDVLPSFFYHDNNIVKMAALEVYVRRSYQAYELKSLKHEKLSGNKWLVEFRFLLPSSHPHRVSMNIKRTKHLSEDLSSYAAKDDSLPPCERIGAMTAIMIFSDLFRNFAAIIRRFRIDPVSPMRSEARKGLEPLWENQTSHLYSDEPIHIINVAILKIDAYKDDALATMLEKFVHAKKSELIEYGIRRITILIIEEGGFPKYFTYRANTIFQEDTIYRHLEPALAFQLEISRMQAFDIAYITTDNPRMHVYFGKGRKSANESVTDRRFFIRMIIRHSDFVTKDASYEYLEKEGERYLLEALDTLEVLVISPEASTDCNHIFLNFVPTVIMDPTKIEENVRRMVLRYGKRLLSLRVLQAEIKMTIRLYMHADQIGLRLVLNSESGYFLSTYLYREYTDNRTGRVTFQSYGKVQGPMHGLSISVPYMTKDHLQSKRYQAQQYGTTYVYDFPELFKQAVSYAWDEYARMNSDVTKPDVLISCEELVLDDQGQLIVLQRLPGENQIGMIAWKIKLFAPECPEGREIILIANDITLNIGSFGLLEDEVFMKASELARRLGIPRIYISVNSGARIGLAEEVKSLFKIAWENQNYPERGFKYLYLTPADFAKFSKAKSVKADLIEDEGESRYKITDIIGMKDGLGVENLSGSGMIAGETSQAYKDIVTISLVTCRSVGIGAYLIRLGQRVIQAENTSIILTGAQALNKVLGRQVYTSNAQLGGVQIMYHNGVSHLTVHDDFEGIYSIVKWLSFVAKSIARPLKSRDAVDREIGYVPSKSSFDARWMLSGKANNDGQWVSGFFDKDSFIEIQRPWAQTVIAGRARLGGIPVGVITAETRAVVAEIPADPANTESEAVILSQAGQVWYPDSSYKTAQAINDFGREGLPLMIFANWRGFSGGQRDMFDEILKFGSYIVDALREYKQPILIYIPPCGELRGGAWVVLDPTINPNYMEMYADKESRGGVLEPEGTVAIKFKKKDIIKTMNRLDANYASLSTACLNKDLKAEERKKLENEKLERENFLAPMYHEAAVMFADLHDTAGRMREKGVIREILDWKTSRRYFYWRLKRLLAEHEIKQLISAANP
ncbi:uncharacterized protein TRIADDRAFT_22916, partial [Trichoplax adhaerens]